MSRNQNKVTQKQNDSDTLKEIPGKVNFKDIPYIYSNYTIIVTHLLNCQ